MVNNYAGKCEACDEWVEEGAGLIQKVDEEWITRCISCGIDPPDIKIVMYNDEALVKPGGHLGKDHFDEYRSACEQAGTRYSKAAGGNVCPFGSIARVIEELEKRGFDCIVDGDVADAVRTHVDGARTTIAKAESRVVDINAELAKVGRELFGFQIEGVTWLTSRMGALLADEMGLGKTVQTLVALSDEPAVLVICPAIAKGVWLREAAKWRPDIKVTVLKGRKSFRWPEPGEMVIINYDILPDIVGEDSDTKWRAQIFEAIPKNLTIIGDEIQAIKNPKTLRTKRFKCLSSLTLKNQGRVWGLTATPIMNRQMELWNILKAIGIHTEAFSNWDTFVMMMGGKEAKWGGQEWGKPSRLCAEHLSRVCLRRERKDVMPDLPGKLWADLVVDVDRNTRKLAGNAMKALKAIGIDFNDALDATMFAKVQGTAFDELSAARAALATAKIPHLLKLVQQHEEVGEPLIVFSAHRAPIDIFKEREGWRVITGDVSPAKRTQIEDDFQNGKLKGVAATIAAGGTAITLTFGCQQIFVDRDWTPMANAQAEDRQCRIGQRSTVNITNIVANHPLDLTIAEVLAGKTELINATVGEATRTEVAPVIDELEAVAETVAARAPDPKPASVPELPRVPLEAPGQTSRRAAGSAKEEWAQAALLHLSRLTNGAGFNHQDSLPGRLLASQIVHGLTDVQWKVALRIAKAHWQQVRDI